jgi:tripartite-type tricarboxylate transporter receptor subunit TctC
VHADSPIKSLKDLAAAAKAKPGELTYGTTGVGSDDHLAMLLFERQAGVKLNHIPMKGASDVKTGLIGKQIDVASMNIGEAMQAQSGGSAMRNLGQMSIARTNLAPDLPTFKQQGYNIEMSSLRGMAAPRGLPPEIRDRLVKAVERAANDPGFQAQAVKYYAPLRFLNPQQFADVLREAETGFRQMYKDMPWSDR